MGHQNDGALIVFQMTFKPRNRFRIQVVGRFVKQQNIRLVQQKTAKRNTAAFTTRKLVNVCVFRWAAQCVHGDIKRPLEIPAIGGIDAFLKFALLCEKVRHLVVGHRLAERHADFVKACQIINNLTTAFHHVAKHILLRIKVRFLFKIANTNTFGWPCFAAVILFDACHYFKQGRFTCTVVPENTDFYAGQEGQCNTLEKFATARKDLGQVLHDVDILVGCH